MLQRRAARETALKCLYQMEVGGISAEEAMENLGVRDPYVTRLLTKITERREELDERIRPLLKGWKLERLTYLDRAILRIGTYEILFEEEVPDAVAIDEAVELTKKYSDDRSRPFINGILSQLMKEKK
ncbi:N utilization substance protein B homolog [[Clostridium] ultunense Esp]|uniref:transcription antitermination factor NusB n=1 Tax=Thermicanus aegyptius TaxID=94009 RepID=UPI0002B6FC01|nr:transcription antitermination factor NusB [Thermicanus aegyptius]MBE3555171.1 transcription antitermination factor NusB [Thermicanus sp.]CCQ94479.1 N utilization substance protein B homolog [[Clostridium] ultunense Esp]